MLAPDAPASAGSAPARATFRDLTAASAALVVICLIWALADARTLGDAPVWMKPLKFSLSFVVLFGTLALVEARLSAPIRRGLVLRFTGWVAAAAFASEMAWIIHQAARAEASHFNTSTPLAALMYSVVMAGGAVALVASVAVVGLMAHRDRDADLGPGLREGVRLGFGLAFLLTMITAGAMSAGSGPEVGLHPDGAPRLAGTGWSGVTGDLRPAHFLSLHAMQALPLIGWAMDRRGAARPIGGVRMAAAAWTALTVAVFAQALAGMPLIPLG